MEEATIKMMPIPMLIKSRDLIFFFIIDTYLLKEGFSLGWKRIVPGKYVVFTIKTLTTISTAIFHPSVGRTRQCAVDSQNPISIWNYTHSHELPSPPTGP